MPITSSTTTSISNNIPTNEESLPLLSVTRSNHYNNMEVSASITDVHRDDDENHLNEEVGDDNVRHYSSFDGSSVNVSGFSQSRRNDDDSEDGMNIGVTDGNINQVEGQNVEDNELVDRNTVQPQQPGGQRFVATRRLRCLLSILTCPIVPLLLCLIGLLVYVLISAFYLDRDKPCDQPLKPYAFVSLFVTAYIPCHKAVKMWLFNYLRERDGPSRPLRVRVYDEVFQGCILTWIWLGVSFVSDCDTCPETAPHLYFSTRSFVILLVVCLLLLALPLMFLPCIYLWLVRSGALSPSSVMNQAAPPDVLEGLDHIDYEASNFDDIINPKECCICMNDFGDEEAGDIIVRTECGHVFHKSCLGGWLATSRICPLCRENLVTLHESRSSSQSHQIQNTDL